MHTVTDTLFISDDAHIVIYADFNRLKSSNAGFVYLRKQISAAYVNFIFAAHYCWNMLFLDVVTLTCHIKIN